LFIIKLIKSVLSPGLYFPCTCLFAKLPQHTQATARTIQLMKAWNGLECYALTLDQPWPQLNRQVCCTSNYKRQLVTINIQRGGPSLQFVKKIEQG